MKKDDNIHIIHGGKWGGLSIEYCLLPRLRRGLAVDDGMAGAEVLAGYAAASNHDP